MTVPNTFANATTAIPLVQLDQNFNTGITLGNTTVYLGNTTTSFGNVTLTNATVSSGTVGGSTAINTSGTLAAGNTTVTGTLSASGIITATNGINFGQTTLTYYGEGTWTPTDASGAGLSFSGVTATYTKLGRWVNYIAFLSYPATASGLSAVIGSLPFTASGNAPGSCLSGSATATVPMVNSGATTLSLYTDGTVNNKLNSAFSSANVYLAGGYST